MCESFAFGGTSCNVVVTVVTCITSYGDKRLQIEQLDIMKPRRVRYLAYSDGR